MKLQLSPFALRAAVLSLAFGIIPIDGVAAQSYPSRPIRIISPFSAGSAPDALAKGQSILEHQSLLLTPRPLGRGDEILDRERAWPAVGDEPLQNDR